MRIAHHPSLEGLLSCSAGSMPEALAAVMASHVCICQACRKELALMEEIGVELFNSIKPSALTQDAPVVEMRRAQADPASDAAAASLNPGMTAGGVPHVIAPSCGDDLDNVAWRRLAPGVQYFPIPLSPGAKGFLYLMKAAPGTALPEHGHSGSELTLVLRGSFSDITGRYGLGDVADLDAETEHQPIADANEGCVCLVASDKEIRFKSMVGRLIQPFTGL